MWKELQVGNHLVDNLPDDESNYPDNAVIQLLIILNNHNEVVMLVRDEAAMGAGYGVSMAMAFCICDDSYNPGYYYKFLPDGYFNSGR